MRKIIFLYLFIIQYAASHCQSIGIGTTTPAASAILELKSAAKCLLIPRTSTVTRTAIVNPAKGLLMYDTTAGNFFYHNGTVWVVIPGGSISLSGWSTTGNAGTNPATNYMGTSDNASLLFRVNNLPAGKLTNNGNVFFGNNGGLAASTGYSNIGIGSASLKNNTTKSNLVAIGDSALFRNGTNIFHDAIQGLSNVAIGSKALYSNATGSWNTAVGFNALKNNIGYLNTTQSNLPVEYEGGNGNTALGANSLLNNDYGLYNTATGANSLTSNKGGSYNTASGFQTLFTNVTGSDNTAMGNQALKGNTIGGGNRGVGSGALKLNNAGGFNVAVGYNALLNNGNGASNNAIGVFALQANTTGGNNVALGASALQNNLAGSNNVAVGTYALSSSQGSDNTAFGYGAGSTLSSGSNNIFIGNSIFPNISNTASNQLNIGNWIEGYNGNIGIGIASPNYKLHIGQSATGLRIEGPATAGGIALGIGGFGDLQIDKPGTAGGRFTIKENGNVGIGTATPTSKLEVAGAMVIKGDQTTHAQGAWLEWNKDNGGGATYLINQRGGGAGGIIIGELDAANNVKQNLIIEYNGNATLAGVLTQNSDARFKTNIQPLSSALQNLQQLNGYTYNWIDKTKDNDLQIGLLAQEIQKIYPALVKQDANGTLSVNYISLVPVLIEGMKEQQKQIEQQNERSMEQQRQIDQQNKRSIEQQKQIEKLQELVNALLKK